MSHNCSDDLGHPPGQWTRHARDQLSGVFRISPILLPELLDGPPQLDKVLVPGILGSSQNFKLLPNSF